MTKLQSWNNILYNNNKLLSCSPLSLDPFLSSDLFELQLQASCDSGSQGGAKFSALTGPARGLPRGDNPQSPKGLKTLPSLSGCLIKCL